MNQNELALKAKAAQILSFFGWETWKIEEALSVDEGKVLKLIAMKVRIK